MTNRQLSLDSSCLHSSTSEDVVVYEFNAKIHKDSNTSRTAPAMHSPAGRHHREHLSLKDAAAVRETMRVTYPKLVSEDTRTHATIHSRTVRIS
ncbi:hypothetical protein EVAR_71829_1 [Eumeta japonica]|uniref:Uncharacterized protein n=1 Tax=Eumeta variegata TaxID=151549 RepID=A0A4C1T6D5_EUMVA|nr:hypothetical protein EVAR_71829_1 [Eumeta japonica]